MYFAGARITVIPGRAPSREPGIQKFCARRFHIEIPGSPRYARRPGMTGDK
jgi:hypothetical protein